MMPESMALKSAAGRGNLQIFLSFSFLPRTMKPTGSLGSIWGADDYVVKPFHVRELIARVKSFLRRRRGEVLSQVASYEIRDLFIDKERFEVRRKKAWISLTPTEFSLLDILASAPDRVFSRMQLLEKAMGGAYYEGAERTIDTHIRNLRKKLEPDPSQPIYIVTVYGVGYKFQGARHEA